MLQSSGWSGRWGPATARCAGLAIIGDLAAALLPRSGNWDATGMQRLYLASHRFDSLAEDLGALDAMGFVVEQIELQGMSRRELTVLPHHNDPARRARHRAVLEQDAGRGRIVALADDQAIEVRGADWRIVPLG
jgi:hypothetical protein